MHLLQVSYVRDIADEIPPQDGGTSYETPLRSGGSTSTSTTTSAPEGPPSKGPYRAPIRVQVGRVVRVQNGTTLGTVIYFIIVHPLFVGSLENSGKL